MQRDAIQSLVQQQLDTYGPSTDGVERLRAALVEPYLQRFELRETHEQIVNPQSTFAEFWVVAEGQTHCQWYDPASGEFGLGMRLADKSIPVSIGVRGDLVGVFLAM